MSNFQNKYKKKPDCYENAATGRLMRAELHEGRRRDYRANNFSKYRDIPKSPMEQVTKSSSNQEEKLRKWQMERALKRKLEQQTKKPVFKVGVVHHRFYSPTANDRINSKTEPCHTRGVRKVKHNPTPPKRITRATQKRLDAKKAANAPISTSATPALTPKLNVTSTKSRRKRVPLPTKLVSTSFAPENHPFNAPTGLPNIPLFGRYAISRDSTADEAIPQYSVNEPWSPQRLRNKLERQCAIDRFNLDGAIRNSSNENEKIPEDYSDANKDDKILPKKSLNETENEKIRLKNSSSENEDEIISYNSSDENEDDKVMKNSSDEIKNEKISHNSTNVNEKMIHEPSSSVAQLNDIEDIDTMVLETKTPPRSGSPVPATFSPYVTMSRGKDNARRERRSKLGLNTRTPPDEIPTKETVMQNLNVSVEEEERTAQYFKFILQREIDRLAELCEKWETIKSDPTLTEDAQLLINQTVGQTSLLMRKKFERFRGLVNDCATGKGEMLVQCRDLQGFWDMVYMEVKDCDSRFLKLDELRSKNWIEEENLVVTNNKISNKKKTTKAAKPKISGKSSARSWILARRKKMSEDSNDEATSVADDNESKPSISETTQTSNDKISRRSMRKSSSSSSSTSTPRLVVAPSGKATPARKTPTSLLQKVQLSEASKSVLSPLAVMKISKMCKTPEVRLDDTITYVNSDQTPGKGILKKSEDIISLDSTIARSARKVDFNDDVVLNDIPIDENVANSMDLARALAHIDSYDSDASDNVFEEIDRLPKNVTLRRIEKRLDFEDESFNETENTDTAESAMVVAATPEIQSMPIIQVTEPTPLRELTKPKSRINKRASRRTSNIVEQPNEEMQAQLQDDTATRVLRNRKIVATPNKANRSVKSSPNQRKLALDSSAKENDDPENNRIMNTEFETSQIAEQSSEELTKRRRSTRKSVRFNAEDCSACAESVKPVHPMTPHARRSRKVSLLGDNTRQSIVPYSNGDLMLFDSPKVVPSRVRRGSEAARKSSAH